MSEESGVAKSHDLRLWAWMTDVGFELWMICCFYSVESNRFAALLVGKNIFWPLMIEPFVVVVKYKWRLLVSRSHLCSSNQVTRHS